jgi:hypothetical protein
MIETCANVVPKLEVLTIAMLVLFRSRGTHNNEIRLIKIEKFFQNFSGGHTNTIQ